MNRKVRTVSGLIVAAFALIVTTVPAKACTCGGPSNLQEAVEGADLAIRGRVERVYTDPFWLARTAIVRVSERWKGPNRTTLRIRLDTPFISFGCGTSFVEEAEYMVVANEAAGGFQTGSCSGNMLLSGDVVYPDGSRTSGTGLSSADREALGASLPPPNSVQWLASMPGGWVFTTFLVMVWLVSRSIRRQDAHWARVGARFGRRYGLLAGVSTGAIVGAVWLAMTFAPMWTDEGPIRSHMWREDLIELGSSTLYAGAWGAWWAGLIGVVLGHFAGAALAVVSAKHAVAAGVTTSVVGTVLGVWLVRGVLLIDEYQFAAVLIAAGIGVFVGRRLQRRILGRAQL